MMKIKTSKQYEKAMKEYNILQEKPIIGKSNAVEIEERMKLLRDAMMEYNWKFSTTNQVGKEIDWSKVNV